MDLVKIMETFPTQQDCITYLERLRWQGYCLRCGRKRRTGRRKACGER